MKRTAISLALLAILVTDTAGAEPGPVPRVISPIIELGPYPRELRLDSRTTALIDQVVTQIDRHVDDFWKKNGVQPAPLADDAEYLRRVSLDLIGRVPTVAEVRAFLDNKSPGKRLQKLEELLNRSAYSNHMATIYRHLWAPQIDENNQFLGIEFQFESWLRGKFRDNVSMDKVVRDLVTVPTLFSGRAPQRFGAEPSPFAFAQVNEFKPENMAASASRLFLGVKIECAQCHNHPHAPYKREQFWELAAFFADIQPAIANASDAKAKREIRIPETSKIVEARYFNDPKQPEWSATKSPREMFADWLIDRKNPFFSRNMANRAWAHLLGTGLIEPIDEPAADNPPVIPEVLDALANGFVESGFDLKFLFRAIVRSKAYQLSSKQTHDSQAEPRTFGRVAVKMMTAEQLYDSLAVVTGLQANAPADENNRFGGQRRAFLTKFSSPEKVTEKQTSILQALTMMNGRLVDAQTTLESSVFLSGVVNAPFFDDRGRIETLYLAALGRQPTPAELDKVSSFVARGGTVGDSKKALSDLFWALLNSSEFILNH